MRTRIDSLKGYIITEIKPGERGNVEIWGKVQGALKAAPLIKLMQCKPENLFDGNGNWFDVVED